MTHTDRSARALACAFALACVFALAIAAPALAGQAEEAAAADLLERRMKQENPADWNLLKGVEGKQIVVVQGSMDHIEQVLAAAKIRHVLIRPDQVAGWDLTADHILMVNCPGNMPQAGLSRIKKFVTAGGLLYTTDWALLNVVQKAFPNTIAYNGKSTGDHVTPVVVHAKHDDLMSNMLLREGTTPQWWLEGGSYPIVIQDKRRVEVLASSAEMQKLYQSAPVVVRFKWEDGEVIHVVSHFYRQAATTGPDVAAAEMVDDVDGLTDADRAAFKSGAGRGVGGLGTSSSYAFQKMTSNLIVNKQKANAKLDKSYTLTPKNEMTVGGRRVTKGGRLKVVDANAPAKDGKKRVRVRDDRGNEEVVFEDDLVTR